MYIFSNITILYVFRKWLIIDCYIQAYVCILSLYFCTYVYHCDNWCVCVCIHMYYIVKVVEGTGLELWLTFWSIHWTRGRYVQCIYIYKLIHVHTYIHTYTEYRMYVVWEKFNSKKILSLISALLTPKMSLLKYWRYSRPERQIILFCFVVCRVLG